MIEAVFEDMQVKKQVFEKLDKVAKAGAILASNTSTLDVNKIADFTQRPQDVIGLHFFSPANVSKLLEIVRGAKSAKDVVATSMAVSKQIKKIGVISGVCDGFIGNRMMNAYFRQMELLLDVGALPAANRQGLGEIRLCDGTLSGQRPRRQRYSLVHPQAPVCRVPGARIFQDPGPHLRTGSIRAEDRRRMV